MRLHSSLLCSVWGEFSGDAAYSATASTCEFLWYQFVKFFFSSYRGFCFFLHNQNVLLLRAANSQWAAGREKLCKNSSTYFLHRILHRNHRWSLAEKWWKHICLRLSYLPESCVKVHWHFPELISPVFSLIITLVCFMKNLSIQNKSRILSQDASARKTWICSRKVSRNTNDEIHHCHVSSVLSVSRRVMISAIIYASSVENIWWFLIIVFYSNSGKYLQTIRIRKAVMKLLVDDCLIRVHLYEYKRKDFFSP